MTYQIDYGQVRLRKIVSSWSIGVAGKNESRSFDVTNQFVRKFSFFFGKEAIKCCWVVAIDGLGEK